ncbi:hypothetical protein EWM64_g9906 [Hericium alpestre]|uniref:Uncharacterized protein n=1 Tax=Hericium alpestre TaxID=135208 RepID=A0A4Y9ZJ89_9AGAM|nr:hypothetical protein EWM64_g9906 [Hericium alpestre]
MLGIHDAGDGATLPFIFCGSYKDDDDNTVYEDAFMSQVILQTLAVAHLQSVSEMPKSSWQPDWSADALALATAAIIIHNFTPEKWDALAKAASKLLQPKRKVINASGKSAICARRHGLKALANK